MEPNVVVSQWGTVAQWVGAVATTFAVLVALFKDEIMRRYRKPELEVQVSLEPPDSHLTRTYYLDPAKAPYPPSYISCDLYYFRLRVHNNGRARAERVQVYLSAVELRRADEGYQAVHRFLPMNLRWSHARDGDATQIFADGISPGMRKHCDLCHVIDPHHQANFGVDLTGVEELTQSNPILILDLEVAPTNKGHMLAPGDYRLTIEVAASNCEPITRKIDLSFRGWYPREQDMLARGIALRII